MNLIFFWHYDNGGQSRLNIGRSQHYISPFFYRRWNCHVSFACLIGQSTIIFCSNTRHDFMWKHKNDKGITLFALFLARQSHFDVKLSSPVPLNCHIVKLMEWWVKSCFQVCVAHTLILSEHTAMSLVLWQMYMQDEFCYVVTQKWSWTMTTSLCCIVYYLLTFDC